MRFSLIFQVRTVPAREGGSGAVRETFPFAGKVSYVSSLESRHRPKSRTSFKAQAFKSYYLGV